MPTLTALVAHTPTTVWILLAVLVALGVRQASARRIGAQRVLLAPAVLGVLSLAGAVRTFGTVGPLEPLLAWALGAALGAITHRALDRPRGVVAHADGSFEVPGSYAPLAIMVGVFTVHYVVHAALAIAPGVASRDGFVLAASAAYGLPSGLLAARARRIWAARQEVPSSGGAPFRA